MAYDTKSSAKRVAWHNLALAGAFIAILWALWIGKRFFGFDIADYSTRTANSPYDSTPLYFWVAVICTTGVVLYTILMTRREMRFATQGLRNDASVSQVHKIWKGLERITYEYEVNGRIYQKKFRAHEGEYRLGDKIAIVVNPIKHSSSMMASRLGVSAYPL